jgi:hypothetical protein
MLRMGLLDRHWLMMDKFIVQEILRLYAGTDAYHALGYDTWPGSPAGLKTYQERPVPTDMG